jgi:hypothetical protein
MNPIGFSSTSNEVRESLAFLMIPKSGVKFAVFVQICPKIGVLLSEFLQQSIKFHKTSFRLPAVLAGERVAESSPPMWRGGVS